MSALGNFSGAAGGLTGLILTGAKTVPVYGQILAGGSAAIFMTETAATVRIQSQARADIAAYYSGLTTMESNAVGKLTANQDAYNQHCKLRAVSLNRAFLFPSLYMRATLLYDLP